MDQDELIVLQYSILLWCLSWRLYVRYNILHSSALTCLLGITFGTLYMKSNWSWRLPSLLQAAPSAVQLVLVILLPESPRWLVSRGKGEKALEIIAKYHANGDRENSLVRFEYAEMQASIKQGEQKGRWGDLFATRKSSMLRKLTAACPN